jgi:hypothetical protein
LLGVARRGAAVSENPTDASIESLRAAVAGAEDAEELTMARSSHFRINCLGLGSSAIQDAVDENPVLGTAELSNKFLCSFG